jgi:SAM-dependent methyltransferase
VVLLFSVTVFLSAGLLFVVQPMVGKMLLPLVGGVPTVWNTCMVFFQAALLAGYGFTHAVTTRLAWWRQVACHLALALVALAVLPIRFRPDPLGTLSVADDPIPWLLLRLAAAVGLPLVVLSATTPTLQRWFARTSHPAARDPYFLYAASNLGSLVALLSYPLLIESHMSLGLQSRAWAGGYLGLVALVAACGLASARAAAASTVLPGPAPAPEREGLDQAERIATPRRVRWVALALVPSSYLLGVTTFLSTDIAAVPLLWVVPLALYLLSFVLVFAPKPLVPHRLVARALPALVLVVVLVDLSGMTLPLWLLIPLHLTAFFVAAVSCHGELALDRPSPSRLTEYYLVIALGGALGGVLNAILAPVLFDRIVEYPLAMVLSCLLGRAGRSNARKEQASARYMDIALPLALTGVTAALVLLALRLGLGEGRTGVASMFALPAIICYTFVERPVRFSLGLTALLLAGQLNPGPHGRPLHQERTFFGVVRVTVDAAGRFHQLVHGSTLHGRQRRSGPARDEPLSYYHPRGPAGDIFARFRESRAARAVAVVGLGAGSLCAHAREGETWVFYEIDPAVERVARDPAYFTFWRDCRADRLSAVRGDGRFRLAESPDGRYGMLVVDAFSSDAIPVHLVTREALELYRRKLAPGGWIVFHISSRYVDLGPVLASLARDAGWVVYARDDLMLSAEERQEGKDPSRWAVMAQERSELGALADSARWRRLGDEAGVPVWTDEFSNLWSVVRWE